MTIVERYAELFAPDHQAAQRASAFFPDGISSDSRRMSPFPVHVSHAAGSHKWSLGGRQLIDYWAGHGALLLGHNPPAVVAAVTEQIRKGTHFSACHPYETEWAQRVVDLIPSAEKIRFTASGTEANQLALQLARTYTGKPKLLRFTGHYHGWQAPLLVGSDMAPDTAAAENQALVCPPHDLDGVEHMLASDPQIGCIILEPTGASSGVVPEDGEFLQGLRKLTRSHGVLLIFDEIVTGFRVSPGGAQAHYSVLPDLTTLAKILAGGLPGGAVAGREDVMACLSVEGTARSGLARVAHLGTFNGNPLSAVAGTATLDQIKTGEPQRMAEESAAGLRAGLNRIIDRNGLDWAVYGEFSTMKFLIGHGDHEIRARDFDPYRWDYRKLLQRGDARLLQALRLGMLINGVDISPSSALTSAHSAADIASTLSAFEATIDMMKQECLVLAGDTIQ